MQRVFETEKGRTARWCNRRQKRDRRDPDTRNPIRQERRLLGVSKGRIDLGETAQQAAVREVEEETGVTIRIAGDLDHLEYKSEDGPVLVEFFLAVATGEGKQVDDREIRWCGLEEASALLSFDEAAEMLRRAVPFIEALGSGLKESPANQ